LTRGLSFSLTHVFQPPSSSPPPKKRNHQDERRAEQNLRDFRNSKNSAAASKKGDDQPLPEATNVLDAVADDAAAAVEGAAAAARSAAASVREWVLGGGGSKGEGAGADQLPPAPVRGDGTFFQVKGEAARAPPSPLSPHPSPRYRPGPYSSGSSSPISPAASEAITTGLALLAAAAAVAAVARRLCTGSWGPRRKEGRWVRDRSLGGKMIFVEDGDLSSYASKLRKKSINADLFLDDGEEVDPSDAAAAAAAASGSRKAATAKEQQLPSWWAPPRPSSSTSSSSSRFEREALTQALREDPTFIAATATLRQLEDSKLSGRDYSLSQLVAIRTALGDSGVSLKPRTGSQRDAMFRAAATAAAEEASEGGSGRSFSSPLRWVPPNEFVSGCASDLGVPTEEAVNMSCAAVAAKARALLVDALASRRGGDFTESLLLVAKLASLLSALPLVEGGPQAPMVATALSQRATLEERRALFEEFLGVVGGSKVVKERGSRERSAAVVAAECLGFDAALVVPPCSE